MELKKLADDIRTVAGEGLNSVKEDIRKAVMSFVSSLVERYQKEVDARRRLHNKLVEINGKLCIHSFVKY